MSREEKLAAPASIVDLPRDTLDDVRVRVDVRLSLQEIADLEEEQLRSAGKRKPCRTELCQLAGRLYQARRTRERMLDPKRFGDAAWDLLLALYYLPTTGERLTVTALSLAAGLQPTTGIRWQRLLTEEGLIERGPKEIDQRKQFFRLTSEGRSLMERYLTRLYYCDIPTPPEPESAGG